MCDLETSRIGAPYIYIYIYDISSLRVNGSILNHHSVSCVMFKVYMVVTLKNTVLWDVLA